MQNLLNVADKYDILHIKRYIAFDCRKLLEINPKDDAWEVLCIAPHLDDQNLAKMALRLLGDLTPPCQWSVEQAEQLGLRYYCGAVRAWATAAGNYSRMPSAFWESTSKYFNV